LITMVNCLDCHKVSTGVWSIWHKLTIHMNKNDKMARLGENDGFQWRKGAPGRLRTWLNVGVFLFVVILHEKAPTYCCVISARALLECV
jgi:hypothetical protein